MNTLESTIGNTPLAKLQRMADQIYRGYLFKIRRK